MALTVVLIVLGFLAVAFVLLLIRYFVCFGKRAGMLKKRLHSSEGFNNYEEIKAELRRVHLRFIPFYVPKGEKAGKRLIVEIVVGAVWLLGLAGALLPVIFLTNYLPGGYVSDDFRVKTYFTSVCDNETLNSTDSESYSRTTGQSKFKLEKGTAYNVSIESIGTAESGYCELVYLGNDSKEETYTCKGKTAPMTPKGENSKVAFTLYADEDGYYTVAAYKGTHNDRGEIVNGGVTGQPQAAVLRSSHDGDNSTVDNPIPSGAAVEFDLVNYVVDEETGGEVLSQKDIYYTVQFRRVKDDKGYKTDEQLQTLNFGSNSYDCITATGSKVGSTHTVTVKGKDDAPLPSGVYEVRVTSLSCAYCNVSETDVFGSRCECTVEQCKKADGSDLCGKDCVCHKPIVLYFSVGTPFYTLSDNDSWTEMNIYTLASTKPITIKYSGCAPYSDGEQSNIRADEQSRTVTIDPVTPYQHYRVIFMNPENASFEVSQGETTLQDNSNVATASDRGAGN